MFTGQHPSQGLPIGGKGGHGEVPSSGAGLGDGPGLGGEGGRDGGPPHLWSATLEESGWFGRGGSGLIESPEPVPPLVHFLEHQRHGKQQTPTTFETSTGQHPSESLPIEG
ncbi:unnamed protein product [Rotaria sordida]|uniref:Uncharacterized protein n=1 Tax=Rotaria sordida TaxID=392033 RepID=A0A815KMC0_9BILA|nr:unnamed protein product [Rotaria sordida]CAF1395017.1 unnamed protein product [Rotaria sordida]